MDAAPKEQEDVPLRLVIEPLDDGSGGFTYKLFDRATGQLKMELRREEAEKLTQSASYSAGQIFSAKV